MFRLDFSNIGVSWL